jgi:hypothetical protein
LRNPGVLAQDERADDAAGGKTAIAQHLRQQPHVAADRKADVVADAGFEGQTSRQQRRMRRQRLRRV